MNLKLYSQSEKKPFPYHITYNKSCIKPNNVSQTSMDKKVREFYQNWQSRFIKTNKKNNQSFVLADNSGNNKVISEGQGYGMIITVLMAGYEKNSKKKFDNLFRYYYAHRCKKRGTALMNWVQFKNGLEDYSSATDGDMDIAYSLLLADKQWGSNGEFNYLEKAKALISDIKRFDVNKISNSMLTSNNVEIDSKNGRYFEYFTTRSSDFMPSHLRAFNKITGDIIWNKIVDSTYSLFHKLQINKSQAGLLPDFIVDINTHPNPAPKRFINDESVNCGAYDYNACRIPWRLGTDYLLHNDQKSYVILNKMNNWIRRETKSNPSLIADGYNLKGFPLHSKPDALHLSFIAPFGISAMIDKKNQDWLNKIWSLLISVNLKDYTNDNNFGYYDNTIKLISMIIISGNYWEI